MAEIDLVSLGKWCGAISAIAGVIIPAGIWTRKRYVEGRNLFRELIELPRKHTEIMDLVTEGVNKVKEISEVVNKELRVNGGGSMLDAIRDLRTQSAISDGKWKVLASTLSMISWESNEHGLCVWASPDMLRTLGCQEMDVLGESWRSLIAEKDRERVFKGWDDAVKQHRSFIMCYNWISIKNELIPIQVESHVIRTADGKVKGYVAVVRVLESETCPIGLKT
jgi:PAS domain S-box-containing protein